MVRLRWSTMKRPVKPPRVWLAWGRWHANQLFKHLSRKPPFKVTIWEMRGPPPGGQLWAERVWRDYVIEANLPVAVALLVVGIGATIAWKLAAGLQLNDLWPELGGSTLDILVVLILFEHFQQRRAKRTEIDRQREVIDDYKRWDSEEARLLVAGAIRRLNRFGVVKLDLSGAVLSNFHFARAGIESLAGSTFYDGSWGERFHHAEVRLVDVTFDHVDCSAVMFSPYDPFEALKDMAPRPASFRDCTFMDCDLSHARFNGAELVWTKAPPEDLYEYDEDSDGRPFSMQVAYGPFDSAQLHGAKFRACRFENADFRGSEGITTADFFRAKGLEAALFDTDEAKAYALASASRSEEDGLEPGS